ncbi:XRE family transcriptional regulator [Curtobacterium sp. APC 4022]|uniref:helix-turn-helix domain-containing protein n=1 Tax=Curtobacterium sp. APC 4022 TaxID=3035201 RepID=UPI0025B2F360|nr:XRE family transcriptional regulator [Curtobacterium sp. APC 4022]MDN3478537.1 helix-turn-helix domain-containing protein [Curtobacterium sp. APC 4022]
MPPGHARASMTTLSAAAIIRDARQRADLTQVQLARRAGVTQSVISTYENGRREPSLAALQRLLLAAGFRTSIDLQPVSEPLPLRELVHRHRDELCASLAQHGAVAVRLLVGASGPHREDDWPADVELVVDLTPPTGMFALMRMQDDAEALLGVRVDVLAADALPDDVLERAVLL